MQWITCGSKKQADLCNYVRMWIQSYLQQQSSYLHMPFSGLYSLRRRWCLSSLVVIEQGLAVFVRQHPSHFPSQHTDTGGCVVITGAHKRGSNTPIWNAGGWFVVLGWSSTAPVCRLHAVVLFLVIKISKHVVQIPPARVRIGHGTGKRWVHWCFEKPNRFACEGFQLMRKCLQFLKNILFVLVDGRRHSTNKRSAHKFYGLKKCCSYFS